MGTLSEHFDGDDVTRSETAARLGIDNNLPGDLLPTVLLSRDMMERIRAKLCALAGREIRINVNSWYRGPALNTAIPGSSRASHHMLGGAVDWEAPDFGRPEDVARALEPYVDELGIGQMLYEGSRTANGSVYWVHTSCLPVQIPINRVLTKRLDGTYAVGIVPA
jgi:hypothetical protein